MSVPLDAPALLPVRRRNTVAQIFGRDVRALWPRSPPPSPQLAPPAGEWFLAILPDQPRGRSL